MKNKIFFNLAAILVLYAPNILVAGGINSIKENSGFKVTLERVSKFTKKEFYTANYITNFSGKNHTLVAYWGYGLESLGMKDGNIPIGLIMVGRGDLYENPVAVMVWASQQMFLDEEVSREKFIKDKEPVSLAFLFDRYHTKCNDVPHCTDYILKIDVDEKTNAVTVNGIKYGIIEE